jgi:hypothetical protein
MERSYDTYRTERYLTAHARARTRARGTTLSMVAALDVLADHDVPVGGGRVSITLSRAAAEEARADGYPPALLDLLRKRAMVVGHNGDLARLIQRGAGIRWRA